MSSLDLTASISTQEVSSGYALLSGYTSPWGLEKRDSWSFSNASVPSPHLANEFAHTHVFRPDESDATTFAYSFEKTGVTGGHFVTLAASSEPEQLRDHMLKRACHLLVDMTPASGMNELLERVKEVYEFYVSMHTPLLMQPENEPVQVEIDPIVNRTEREHFSALEE